VSVGGRGTGVAVGGRGVGVGGTGVAVGGRGVGVHTGVGVQRGVGVLVIVGVKVGFGVLVGVGVGVGLAPQPAVAMTSNASTARAMTSQMFGVRFLKLSSLHKFRWTPWHRPQYLALTMMYRGRTKDQGRKTNLLLRFLSFVLKRRPACTRRCTSSSRRARYRSRACAASW
jgi:hypothetical protein